MTLASLQDLIDDSLKDLAVVRSNGVRVHDVFRGIEEGEPWHDLANRFELTPREIIAAFAHQALGPRGRPRLGLVRGQPAATKWETPLSESAFSKLLPNLSCPARLAFSAGMLQTLDLWDASHEAAQAAEDRGETFVSAYWHGIAHRREPDAGNATYWFRKVGSHPVFQPLAEAVGPWIESDPLIACKLLPYGAWSPYGFIQLTTHGNSAFETSAKRIQREEMDLLLAASIAGRDETAIGR